MNVVLYDLVGWCGENRPGLEGWATLENFRLIMGRVQQATGDFRQQHAWKLQSDFLSKSEGKQYLDDLYGEQAKLRREMSTRHWELIPERN
jgi:hypothetical protein